MKLDESARGVFVISATPFDENGGLDRQSFMTEVKEGKQVVTGVLPKLGK